MIHKRLLFNYITTNKVDKNKVLYKSSKICDKSLINKKKYSQKYHILYFLYLKKQSELRRTPQIRE